jgi:hypothetical protein
VPNRLDAAITDEERAWAQNVLDEGVDTNVDLLSYCRFVIGPAEGASPVRNERGGIVGYSLRETAEEIGRLSAKEAGHLTAAESSTDPEIEGAHRAAAQAYRLARLVRETDAAYAAQSFELGAVGWENLMSPALSLVYMGKSQGMWPHQRAEKDAQEADACADRLMELGRKALADRRHRENVTRLAKNATDTELAEEIGKAKDSDTAAFLILIKERGVRDRKLQASRTKSQKAPASDAPFTEDEEKLLCNTARQTKEMHVDKLTQLRGVPVVTRGDQLKHEAVHREMIRRGL